MNKGTTKLKFLRKEIFFQCFPSKFDMFQDPLVIASFNYSLLTIVVFSHVFNLSRVKKLLRVDEFAGA